MLISTYRARPATFAGPVYCDTSFVIDLFAHAHPSFTGGASGKARARIAEAHAFYIWGRLQGVEFYVSVLAVEEAYQKLLFTPIRAFLQGNPEYTSWKALRERDPERLEDLLTKGRTAVAVFHNFLRGSGLKLVTFGGGRFKNRFMGEPIICRYARALLAVCGSEAMDAFHYALMRRCGISVAAASDRDWAVFPLGDLFTGA